MKNFIIVLVSIGLGQLVIAQKCDTLRIDGVPNPYDCPVKALNIYKGIFKKVSEAIFEPLNKATINYCDNCPPLQDWSHYNCKNVWSHNPSQFSNKTDYDWEAVPTGVPCSQEQEPALFLANISADLIGIYGNLHSIYWGGENGCNVFKIYQIKQDSLIAVNKKYDDEAFKQIRNGIDFANVNVPGWKQANAKKLLLFDENTYHQMQSNFSFKFTYNKTSIDLYPNDIQPLLKKTHLS